MNINRWLVKQLNISSLEASHLIASKQVLINEKIAIQKQKININDALSNAGETLRKAPDFFYIAYHKPKGIECTLNPLIPNNLLNAVNFDLKFFPIGRLDKESEGLMLLTNDGLMYNQIANALAKVEKEYIVKIDGLLSKQVIAELGNGIEIMGKITNPCVVNQLDEHTFQIILTQGMNRQIRRMCYKLGFDVVKLTRVRIGKIQLGNMTPNEYIYIEKSEII